MTQPRKTGTILDQLTNWLTPKTADPPPPRERIRLGEAQSVALPDGLFQRMRVRPFDPKLIEMFWPDSLARAKGYQVYEEMQDDPQVRSLSAMKRFSPIMNGWDVTAAEGRTAADAALAAEIAQFCKDNLGDMDRPLERVVGDSLLSTFTGLTIGEKLYRYERSGVYAGKVLQTDTQVRPPSVVDVQFDQHGKITGVVQMSSSGAWTADNNEAGLHPFKFVIHTWDGRYGSPYGRGDGRSVYKHWWAKQFLMKSWAMYMDKFGAPSLYGTTDDSMSASEQTRFLELLGAIQHSGYAVLPENWHVNWLAAPGGSGNGEAFQRAIEWQDSMIAKAILGSTLSTDQPSSGLGLGGGQVAAAHADSRDLIFAMVKADAEGEIVRRQMLRPLVRLNYGNDAARRLTPHIAFNPPSLEDAADLAKIVQGLITSGVVNGKEPWIRQRLHLPAWEEVAEEVRKRELDDAQHQAQTQQIMTPPDQQGQEDEQ